MDEVLKKLLAEKVLNEDTVSSIKGAFETSMREAKAEQENKIRAELVEQYEKDKQVMHEALSQFLEQELNEHVSELKDGVEQVNKLKLEYAEKTSKVKEQAQKFVRKRLGAIESVIESVLKKEIKELHESEVTNRRAYLSAINEKVSELEEDKQKFRKKAAAVLENVINVKVAANIEELREDIKAATQADFGRELYEAFFTTFRRQFFNSNKEFRAITERLKESEAKASRIEKNAKKKLREIHEKAKLEESARKKLEETVYRKEKINKIISGLSGPARSQMKTILESSKTKDLEKNYRKFITNVLKETGPSHKKKSNDKLTEAAMELKTGGRSNVLKESNTEDDDDIVNIRHLAGI